MKILSSRLNLIIVLIGFTLSLALLFNFIPKSPIQSSPALLVKNVTTYGLPIRLKIPSINVNSIVEYVGLTSDGAMDVPKKQGNVAWFKPGQRPGEKGSAVIAGHYGLLKNGTASVFDNLYKLKPGDKIYVEDDKGASVSFVVRESRSFDPKADASGVFGSSDDKAHLNLVTCEGIWNKISKSYSRRFVVFTDKE